MIDGMSTESIKADTIIAVTALSGADLIVATQKVSGTEIANLGVDTAQLANSAVSTIKHAIVGVGSPPVYTTRILAGSNAMTAATSLWVAFGTPFKQPPYIVIGDLPGGDIDMVAITAGSFMVSGTNATIFHWMAVGSA